MPKSCNNYVISNIIHRFNYYGHNDAGSTVSTNPFRLECSDSCGNNKELINITFPNGGKAGLGSIEFRVYEGSTERLHMQPTVLRDGSHFPICIGLTTTVSVTGRNTNPEAITINIESRNRILKSLSIQPANAAASSEFYLSYEVSK